MTYQELDTDNVERPVAASENSSAFAASSITSQADNNYYLQSRAAQESTQSLLFLQNFSISSTNNDASDTKGRPADYLPPPTTPEQKAVGMALTGDVKGLQAQFAALRKDGDTDAEGKLAKEIEAQTGMKVSFDGKNLTLKMPSLDTNDAKRGTTVTVDAKGTITASKYDYAMGVTTETPIDDAAKALKDISRQARINYEDKHLKAEEGSSPIPRKK